MTELIHTHGLTVSHRDFTLGPIDLALPAGYIMGLVGANGAGKTTLLKALLGLAPLDGGGFDLLGRPGGVATTRAAIGVVLDQPLFGETWTAKDIARAYAAGYPGFDKAGYVSRLNRLAVPMATRFQRMSRGTQVKLQLAAAMSHGAKLLLLDEPTAGLDAATRADLMGELQAFIAAGDASVLISTHIVEDLEEIVDYLAYLDHGRLQFSGERDVFLAAYRQVKGGAAALSPLVREAAIGLRETAVGWTAILPVDAATALDGVVCEPVGLNALMVALERGGQVNENSVEN
ncbi:ATP-binding cassette domain-containing protein [Lacticaseibacillus parakribbianus]|uniref:ATP-binding cassette domain-containing protein n=1 Tax=Lacticaseibacillus parakribbianus TaxID=2970927 RepID=UPI0021CB8E61|nr:ABC transporter ATP-binding protein [Lacticaseibacillus parakribbianus]